MHKQVNARAQAREEAVKLGAVTYRYSTGTKRDWCGRTAIDEFEFLEYYFNAEGGEAQLPQRALQGPGHLHQWWQVVSQGDRQHDRLTQLRKNKH